jgi:THO complex subunit 2
MLMFKCHGVLLQLHEFVCAGLDPFILESSLPRFGELLKDFDLEPSVAFYIWRSILAEKIKQYDADITIQEQKRKLLKSMGESEKSDNIGDRNSTEIDMQTASTTVSNGPAQIMDTVVETPMVAASDPYNVPFHLLTASESGILLYLSSSRKFAMRYRLKFGIILGILAQISINLSSPQFYTTFWQLTLYDISVPMQAYSQEVSKLTAEIKKKDADRSDLSPPAVQKKRREREQLQGQIDQLNQEFKIQTSAFQSTKKRLSIEKDLWFDWTSLYPAGEPSPPRNKTVLTILQHCIIPRSLFGPNEAIFSAKFVREMHRLGTKNFSSLTLFDKVTSQFFTCNNIKIFVNLHETIIFTCTNREAENYGRFLREILFELNRWYSDKAVYEKEAIGPTTPGFLKKWSVNASETVYLQYDEFRSVMFKWHKNLTTAFKICLDSRDYMHVRNALAVLEKVIGLYPQIDFHGNGLEEKIRVIAAKAETRGDVQIRAQGYLALLQKSSKSWVSAQKFASHAKLSSRPPSPKTPSTPQSLSSISFATDVPLQRSLSTLNAAAASFKPREERSRYVTFIHA